MRISNATLQNNVMRNLQLSLRELERTQRQMASGRAISQPSDNPVGTAKLLGVNSVLAESAQLQANVRDGLGWLSLTDTMLGAVGEAFHRARELALAGANGTMPDAARAYNAREVDQLLRHVVALANTSLDGTRYLFGGTHHGAVPFTMAEGANGLVASVTPAAVGAGQGTVNYEIIRSIGMQINTEGHALFVTGGLFASLLAVRDGLLGTGNQQTAIGELETAFNRLLDERAVVGARHKRLQMTEQRYEEQHVTLTALKSQIEDVDMAEAIMKFNTREHVYQAALAASARVLQLTLLDYLR
ncbi:MAG: Flagellar hook-associated protein 3 [Firmicutes bacterium]|nr:Flagellar hook-associated protein 3 [candidate division NPL-UPA2 bacterium]MBT9154322.1 Flagellar hook-associated protein 3 [candidate division NPL-UPA2 bacterium]